jgi:phosphonopyruvate decarboxylase
MLTAPNLLDLCFTQGFGFITGTPCSYLKPLINAAIGDRRFMFRDAVNEGDAVAMAAGAALAGARTIVMFQNSGLGNAVNALSSLCHPFRVPMLIFVTHRGEPGAGHDEPQHELMGRIITRLLETLEIPWARLPADSEGAATALDTAVRSMAERSLPYALVIGKSTIAPHPLGPDRAKVPIGTRSVAFTEELRALPVDLPTRTDALRALSDARRADEVLVATTGYTGRELYALGDHPWNVYMVGSMGSASSFGLGLALLAPGRPVTVIDGDGAVLMRMGNLASLGAYAPSGMMHVVLDNESHDSTGGQGTVSRSVALGAVAKACGYRTVVSTDRLDLFAAALAGPRNKGPAFVHLRTKPGAPDGLPRPDLPPHVMWERTRNWIGSATSSPTPPA